MCVVLCLTNAHTVLQPGAGYQSASLGGPGLDSGLTSAQSSDTYGSPQVQPDNRQTGKSVENKRIQTIFLRFKTNNPVVCVTLFLYSDSSVSHYLRQIRICRLLQTDG